MLNTQEIITIIIIVCAFIFAGYKVVRMFRNPTKSCESCVSDCSGCQLADLKKEIEEKKHAKNAESPIAAEHTGPGTQHL
ncbi:MAG: FeoB-associated Cys-rich membrane protein [Lentimicrobiaceae bacterium]|nr:FeoB-associated Cys-rich membrane protein [Lentimicrobiaceae bacterium]